MKIFLSMTTELVPGWYTVKWSVATDADHCTNACNQKWISLHLHPVPMKDGRIKPIFYGKNF